MPIFIYSYFIICRLVLKINYIQEHICILYRLQLKGGKVYRRFGIPPNFPNLFGFQNHFQAIDFLFLSKSQKMDTSNPAVFVNAELLRMHVGRRVRAVIQVLRSDGGGSVVGKSTDEQQVVVKGHPPGPLTTFVEVIGIADSNQSIQADIWTNFGDVFDSASYNSVCQLANGDFKHLFI